MINSEGIAYYPSGKFSILKFKRREVGPKDILIKILYAGDPGFIMKYGGKIPIQSPNIRFKKGGRLLPRRSK